MRMSRVNFFGIPIVAYVIQRDLDNLRIRVRDPSHPALVAADVSNGFDNHHDFSLITEAGGATSISVGERRFVRRLHWDPSRRLKPAGPLRFLAISVGGRLERASLRGFGVRHGPKHATQHPIHRGHPMPEPD